MIAVPPDWSTPEILSSEIKQPIDMFTVNYMQFSRNPSLENPKAKPLLTTCTMEKKKKNQ